MLLFALACSSSSGYSQNVLNRYPNELPGYRFYATAKWKSLEPIVSTIADVRNTLGKPASEVDLSQYFKPYPGDDRAKSPVLTYDLDDSWEALLYFDDSCFRGVPALPSSQGTRLCTVELLPKERVEFGKVKFPPVFKRNYVAAVDAAWDEFSDTSGLSYHVYTTRTRYGNMRPGDLNRIVYGPSDETLASYASKSP